MTLSVILSFFCQVWVFLSKDEPTDSSFSNFCVVLIGRLIKFISEWHTIVGQLYDGYKSGCLTCANCFDRKSIAKAGVLRTTRKGDIITDVFIVALLSLSVAGEHFKNVKRFCVFKVSVQVVWKNYLMKCSGSLVQKKIRLTRSHAHTLTRSHAHHRHEVRLFA